MKSKIIIDNSQKFTKEQCKRIIELYNGSTKSENIRGKKSENIIPKTSEEDINAIKEFHDNVNQYLKDRGWKSE